MTSGTYSLATTVSFLEAVVQAVDHEAAADTSTETRTSLRERFRRAVRLLKRFKATQDLRREGSSIAATSMLGWLEPSNCFSERSERGFFGDILSRQHHNYFASSPPAFPETQSSACADICFPPGFCASQSELDNRVALRPIFGEAPPTIFDAAMGVAVDGFMRVYAAVMDLWSRRHDVVSSSASNKRRPHRSRALDRLFLALMRFAFGFFGTHKVDARNNP